MRAPNPPADLIHKYKKAAFKAAKESYNQHYDTFKSSGMEIDDVCNIALVHLVSYLGSYSIQHTEEPTKKFKEAHPDMSEQDVAKKDLSNLIHFVSQRMKDLVRVCRQKNQHVLGEKTIAVLFQLVDTEVMCPDMDLLKSPFKYGYRRVSAKDYKALREKMSEPMKAGRFVFGGVTYRFVYMSMQPIWLSEYENSDDMAMFNPQPEISSQDSPNAARVRWRKERLLVRYEKADRKNKVRMLHRAISFLGKKGGFEEEIALARKMLNMLRSDDDDK